jgi:hypothetical protein
MFKNKKNNITFTRILDVADLYKPKPASAYIPDWYKETETYIQDSNKILNKRSISTIKRCPPIFDAISMGYIITTHCDLIVTQEDGFPHYQFALPVLNFHPFIQAPKHPLAMKNGDEAMDYPKLLNPWAIKTPPGYSTMFFSPWHRDSEIIIFPGVVDTDKHLFPIHFPFVLKDPKFEGLIPAGTPIVQVMPFKRDAWTSSIGSDEDKKESDNVFSEFQSKFSNFYRNDIWSRKKFS